jgi:hypothetical protein
VTQNSRCTYLSQTTKFQPTWGDKSGANIPFEQVMTCSVKKIVQFDISNGAPFTFLKTLQYPAVVSVGKLQMDI